MTVAYFKIIPVLSAGRPGGKDEKERVSVSLTFWSRNLTFKF